MEKQPRRDVLARGGRRTTVIARPLVLHVDILSATRTEAAEPQETARRSTWPGGRVALAATAHDKQCAFSASNPQRDRWGRSRLEISYRSAVPTSGTGHQVPDAGAPSRTALRSAPLAVVKYGVRFIVRTHLPVLHSLHRAVAWWESAERQADDGRQAQRSRRMYPLGALFRSYYDLSSLTRGEGGPPEARPQALGVGSQGE
jgi:hypothetical protein